MKMKHKLRVQLLSSIFYIHITLIKDLAVYCGPVTPTETASDAETKLESNVAVDSDDPCKVMNIKQLFSLKENAEKKLQNYLEAVKMVKGISETHRKHRINAIKIFQKEINETGALVFESVNSLKRVLKGDYKSLRKLEETSKKRLEELKKATFEEQEEYNAILNAEKEEMAESKQTGDRNKSKKTGTVIRKFVDELINNIAVAADKLEMGMEDESFSRNVHGKGSNVAIETVVRLNDEDSKSQSTVSNEDGVAMLIDSHNNQFVLSKPKDATVSHVDPNLIKDVICIVLFSLALCVPCHWLSVPNLFAYILTGIVLGPSGISQLKSIVQLETLGEFGVFFTLFTLGLDFSPEKFKKIWRVSVFGTCFMTGVMVLLAVLGGLMSGISPRQSIFVATCVSLSSTPVMSKLMSSHSPAKANGDDQGEDYVVILTGILVMQDIQLSMLMGILPVLAGHHEPAKSSYTILPNQGLIHHWLHGESHSSSKDFIDNALMTTWSIIELVVATLGIIFISNFVAVHFISRYFRLLNHIGNRESLVLGVLTLVFAMLMVTDHLGISMELGCFICGAVIGSQSEQTVKQVEAIIEPVRDLFSCLFFSSIGLHVFPSFVLSEIAIMIPITGVLVVVKFCVAASILNYLLPKGSLTKWVVAAGLINISEFAFVLGSRAKRFGLITREVYLIILSVTTLSLLIAPLFWRLAPAFVSGENIWTFRKLMSYLRKPV